MLVPFVSAPVSEAGALAFLQQLLHRVNRSWGPAALAGTPGDQQ